jgi:hypothetical protein
MSQLTSLVGKIIPTDTRAKYVCQAVGRSLVESYSDTCLLVADDGSWDCAWWTPSGCYDPRTKLDRSEKRIGLARFVNRGVELA